MGYKTFDVLISRYSRVLTSVCLASLCKIIFKTNGKCKKINISYSLIALIDRLHFMAGTFFHTEIMLAMKIVMTSSKNVVIYDQVDHTKRAGNGKRPEPY